MDNIGKITWPDLSLRCERMLLSFFYIQNTFMDTDTTIQTGETTSKVEFDVSVSNVTMFCEIIENNKNEIFLVIRLRKSFIKYFSKIRLQYEIASEQSKH